MENNDGWPSIGETPSSVGLCKYVTGNTHKATARKSYSFPKNGVNIFFLLFFSLYALYIYYLMDELVPL